MNYEEAMKIVHIIVDRYVKCDWWEGVGISLKDKEHSIYKLQIRINPEFAPNISSLDLPTEINGIQIEAIHCHRAVTF